MNKRELARLMRQAGEGDGAAACRLGDRYREGDGVMQSWEEAFRWYTIGAEAGEKEAQNNLGTLYLEGYYIPQNYKAAVHWYRLSAEQGANVAQYNLGMRYIHGQGVAQDFAQARMWLERAAEQGYNLAHTEIGIMCLVGEGCSPDREKAKGHLIKAALNGDERAFQHLDQMIPELEASALKGEMRAMCDLPWLYLLGLGGEECVAKAWAWMLWLDTQRPVPDETRADILTWMSDMKDQIEATDTGKAEMQRGKEIYESMLKAHLLPKHYGPADQAAELIATGNAEDRRKAMVQLALVACNDKAAMDALAPMIPELEKAALEGEPDIMLQLPWLYISGLGGEDCQAKAWAWMLWLDENKAMLGGFRACEAIEDFTDMRRSLRFSETGDEDMREGTEIFAALKRSHAVPTVSVDDSMDDVIEDMKAIQQKRISKNKSASKKTTQRLPSYAERRLEQWREACSSDTVDSLQRGKKQSAHCVILSVSAEGGGVTLYGKKNEQWTFWCELNDWTPTLIDDDAIHRRSEVVDSWNEALALLDKQCTHWMDLSPTEVHPEFRERVWNIIEQRHAVKKLVGRVEAMQ